ncbi:hypothetical protein ACBP93_06555 [Paenalcaligenes hominis]|uniref:hypothetical protein n=1 Tax=Paenalcaligenes hominis TaxID=643674 RepID=UPI003525E81F
MKYKITVEKTSEALEDSFEKALSCIASSLFLISPPATGYIENGTCLIIDTELTSCEEVKKSMKPLFADAFEELRFVKIELIS